MWIFPVDGPANIAWYQGLALVFTSAKGHKIPTLWGDKFLLFPLLNVFYSPPPPPETIGGGGGKTIEMWRWWWWRENNRNVAVVVVVEGKQ